jgi:hypothetical protein
MVRNSWVLIGVGCLFTAVGCYGQSYGYNGYGGNRYSYGYGSAAPYYYPPSASQQTQSPASTPVAPPVAPNATSANDSGDEMALPPLVLPIREDWSSAQCPALGVTFTGNSQPTQTSLAQAASFEEARQVRDGGYAEVAECFCIKRGDLSEISKASADAVMTQMAQQFSDRLHMQVKSMSYVASSPLGRYSQLEASADQPVGKAAVMRVYWQGQCSMRVAVVSNESTRLRGEEFLNSLRALNSAATATTAEAAAPAASANTSAVPANVMTALRNLRDEPQASGADAPPPAVPVVPVAAESLAAATSTADGSHDLEAERTEKLANGTAVVSVSSDDSPAPTSSDGPVAGQDVATRLQQLAGLRRKGLITKSEYDAKRQTILGGL